MNAAARFDELCRGTARLRGSNVQTISPSVARTPQAKCKPKPAVGASGRNARGGSFTGQWQQPHRKPTRAEIAAARAKVRADLEKTKAAKEAGVPVDDLYPDFEQLELIPRDQQQLPDQYLRTPVGLPPAAELYYSAAKEH